MNQSFSDDHDSPEKLIEQININVTGLISEAKPVISPSRQFSKQIPFKQTLVNDDIVYRKFKKGLFKRNGSINIYPFASNFEGGNLESVESRTVGVYILRLRQDTNSQHKSGWFYFQVRDIKTAAFKIRGFPKPKLLYNEGMKLCIKQNGKWVRGGSHISYEAEESGEYTLEFNHTFENPQEISQIAYCFPYSYSNLKQFLKSFCRKHQKIVTRQHIARSILGNDVEALVFSANPSKPLIIISARVHPSQTVGSWIAQGFMEWLVSTSQGQHLLENFQVRVIPMLNPDGVYRGNHRFSFAGTDLNRRWKKCNQKLHPQIFFTKSYLQDLDPKRIKMIIDLHGHSRKKGVFFYGCEEKNSTETAARQFPYFLSKISPFFEYSKCCFKVQTSKQGTARIYLWKQLKIPHIYTLQCSLCGHENTKKNFQISDYEKIGADLGRGIHIFFSQTLKEIPEQTQLILTKIKEQFKADRQIFHTEEGSQGSESEPSEGELDQQQVITAIQMFNQSQLNSSKSKINSQTFQSGYSKERSSSFVVAQQKQLSGTNPSSIRKNFRKRVSTSYQSVRSQRKRFDSNGKAKFQHSHTINQHTIGEGEVNALTPLEGFIQAQLLRPQAKLRAQYLNQILGASEQNIADLQFQGGSKTFLETGKLIVPDKLAYSNDLEQKKRAIHNEAFKPGFYGAQYIRVKKYAEKIIKQKQKKQIMCVQSHKIVQRTSGHFKPSGQLKLQVISLQRRIRPDTIEGTAKPKSSRRSSTTNR